MEDGRGFFFLECPVTSNASTPAAISVIEAGICESNSFSQQGNMLSLLPKSGKARQQLGTVFIHFPLLLRRIVPAQVPPPMSADSNRTKIAVCVRSAFISDARDPQFSLRVIEWLELLRILGVDKVFIYIHHLGKETQKVSSNQTYYRKSCFALSTVHVFVAFSIGPGPLFCCRVCRDSLLALWGNRNFKLA